MRIVLLAACLLTLGSSLALGGDAKKAESKADAKAQEKRDKIDAEAKAALDRLFAASASAKALYEKAYGHAAFDNTKVAIGISGGGGSGVAVVRKSGDKTYMKMGTVGVGLGLGGQSYNVVFLFESEAAFRSFVDKGWQADAGASAVAGKEGVNAESTFHDGMAYFVMTEKGLMAAADVAGTKYWKNDKLN